MDGDVEGKLFDCVCGLGGGGRGCWGGGRSGEARAFAGWFGHARKDVLEKAVLVIDASGRG